MWQLDSCIEDDWHVMDSLVDEDENTRPLKRSKLITPIFCSDDHVDNFLNIPFGIYDTIMEYLSLNDIYCVILVNKLAFKTFSLSLSCILPRLCISRSNNEHCRSPEDRFYKLPRYIESKCVNVIYKSNQKDRCILGNKVYSFVKDSYFFSISRGALSSKIYEHMTNFPAQIKSNTNVENFNNGNNPSFTLIDILDHEKKYFKLACEAFQIHGEIRFRKSVLQHHLQGSYLIYEVINKRRRKMDCLSIVSSLDEEFVLFLKKKFPFQNIYLSFPCSSQTLSSLNLNQYLMGSSSKYPGNGIRCFIVIYEHVYNTLDSRIMLGTLMNNWSRVRRNNFPLWLLVDAEADENENLPDIPPLLNVSMHDNLIKLAITNTNQDVKYIGDNYLRNRQDIRFVDLCALYQIIKIGNGFLSRCPNLIYTELKGFSSVASIGNSFLSDCPMMSNINLEALFNVSSFGSHAMCDNQELEEIDIRPLMNVNYGGEYIFNRCKHLKSIKHDMDDHITWMAKECVEDIYFTHKNNT